VLNWAVRDDDVRSSRSAEGAEDVIDTQLKEKREFYAYKRWRLQMRVGHRHRNLYVRPCDVRVKESR
jgi:hypothetical protein